MRDAWCLACDPWTPERLPRSLFDAASVSNHLHWHASRCECLVFDAVYNPIETRLLSLAKRRGCLTVDGVEMFVRQAAAQFTIWTGLRAPAQEMRNIVLQELGQLARR
jgi:shikimate 5-dehydrogenase